MNFCRNSIQGKVLMADDQGLYFKILKMTSPVRTPKCWENCSFSGYVCLRADLYSTTGCCRTSGPKTQRYSCETCNDHGCCSIYEYCVSCCLHPDKVRDLNGGDHFFFLSVEKYDLLMIDFVVTESSIETYFGNFKAESSVGFCLWPLWTLSGEVSNIQSVCAARNSL